MAPPPISLHSIDLPLTCLAYARCGSGEPLVIVPATISRIRDWHPLIQFMGQRFTTYFFELPGHGGSSPFPCHFSSELVGQVVEDFIDALHYDTVTLMGFSFGGTLTLRILQRLGGRVKRLVLLSPCVSHRTLRYSPRRLAFLRAFTRLMLHSSSQSVFLRALHSPFMVDSVIYMLRHWGHVEIYGTELRTTLLSLPASTLDVLACQINEILSAEPIESVDCCDIPCVFGMSTLDPLLSYEKTLALVTQKFRNIWVESFNFPYHQPPEPFTFEGLNRDYGHFLSQL